MTIDDGRDTGQVLRTILSSSTDVQGEWVSRSELYVHPVAHAGIGKSDVQQALHQLRKAERIYVDGGRYWPVGGVEQPMCAGEQ